MKEAFTQFLKNRPKKCRHAKYEWCNFCIGTPKLVVEILPDGTATTGYYITNHDTKSTK